MATTREEWADQISEKLESATTGFSEKFQKRYCFAYLVKLHKKIMEFLSKEEHFQEYKQIIEALLQVYPTQEPLEGDQRKNFNRAKRKVENFANKKFKIVKKGYYIGLWMAMGIALGTPFGVSLGNVAYGFPIGIGIGLAIGAGLEQKAQKEGKLVV